MDFRKLGCSETALENLAKLYLAGPKTGAAANIRSSKLRVLNKELVELVVMLKDFKKAVLNLAEIKEGPTSTVLFQVSEKIEATIEAVLKISNKISKEVKTNA